MTRTESAFVRELRQRRSANDRMLADAEAELARAEAALIKARASHAEQNFAIDVLLAAEGYAPDDDGDNGSDEDAVDGEAPPTHTTFTDPWKDLVQLKRWRAAASPECLIENEQAVRSLRNAIAHGQLSDLSKGYALHFVHSSNPAWEKLLRTTKSLDTGSNSKVWRELMQAAVTAVESGEHSTTRDFVRRALLLNGGPMRMVDVVEAVKEMGSTASDDTIRSALQKALHAGEAIRPERGMYQIASPWCDNTTSADAVDDKSSDESTDKAETTETPTDPADTADTETGDGYLDFGSHMVEVDPG